MEQLNFQLNSNVVAGEYDLIEIIKGLGIQNICVVCDSNLYQNSSHVRSMIGNIQSIYEVYLKLYDYYFEPSYQYLDMLMEELRGKQLDQTLDAFIGIGGGSTMDTAKGLAFLCRNKGPAIQYKGFPEKLAPPIPVIAIPSTTGSGSEVVFNASFIDEDSRAKMGINDIKNFPVVSILDPEIASSAPRSVLASSGCDALVHTLESFVSKSSNPVSRIFSLKAFHLILQNMPTLLNGKGNLSNWSNMQWGAVFAMWGLSNSSSGPTGALSYYLGTHYNVPHGTAGGVFIGKISRLNHERGYHDYADLYGWDPSHDFTLSCERKSEIVVEEIEKLLDQAEIPSNLNECGVPDNEYNGFYRFAEQVKEAFDSNPLSFSVDDIEKILF